MAAVEEDEYNLAFLDADNIDQDETDAASTRVIQLDRDSEIPTRYLIRKIFSPQLEPPYHYHPAAETSQRRKKLIEDACPERFDFPLSEAKGKLCLCLVDKRVTGITVDKYKALHCSFSGSFDNLLCAVNAPFTLVLHRSNGDSKIGSCLSTSNDELLIYDCKFQCVLNGISAVVWELKGERSSLHKIPRWGNQVHSTWGSPVGKARHSPSHPDDLVALLSFEATPNSSILQLDESTVVKITEVLSKKSGDIKLVALRYSDFQILVLFSKSAGYEALGKCFLDGKIEEISHLKLTEIQAVSLATPPPCYIEIAVPTGEGQALKGMLTSLLVSHQSVFPFLCVREPEHKFTNGGSPTNSPASKTRRIDDGGLTSPAVGVMLMFTQRAQKNSERCLHVFKSSSTDWEEVKVPRAISEGDEVYFKAANIDGPLFAVKRLSPCPGVRILLCVNNDVDEMEKFYTLITGKTPLAYNKIEEGLSCRKFPLSNKLELQLVLHPSLKSHTVKNTALCFMMNGVNKMCSEIPGGVRNIGEGHWQVKDPEGNAVILYSLLK